jgi:hypothetical protein
MQRMVPVWLHRPRWFRWQADKAKMNTKYFCVLFGCIDETEEWHSNASVAAFDMDID